MASLIRTISPPRCLDSSTAFTAAPAKTEPPQRISRQIRIYSRLSGMGRRSMTAFPQRWPNAAARRRCAHWRSSVSPPRWPAATRSASRSKRHIRPTTANGIRSRCRKASKPSKSSSAAIAAASPPANAPTCFRSRKRGGTRPPAASSWTFRMADPPITPPLTPCAKCNRFSLLPAFRATPSMCAAIKPSSFHAREHQDQLREARRRGRPMRPLAARSRTSLRSLLHRKPSLLEFRPRQPAQSRRHGRQPRRSRAAAR